MTATATPRHWFEFDRRGGTVLQWSLAVMSALLIGAATFWQWRLPLYWFHLKGDDFVYLGWSRTWPALREHLFAPHNGHIVPLFLLETHVLARLAGSLEALPTILSWASCATLALCMALVGHIVAWETGRPAHGLAAMAAVGFTSVLGPALLWYSASQTLAAGAMILVMLVMLQAFRARGSWWWLALGVLAAVAAPLFWTAGFVAGPVGAAYLWTDGRRRQKLAAVGPFFASVATFYVARGLLVGASSAVSTGPGGRYQAIATIDPAVSLAHTAQAVCEALVFNNLGLDAPTTAAQGVVLIMALAALWAWSRRPDGPRRPLRLPRINPLEAAGGVLTFACFGMIFAVRGTEAPFDGLRALGWYDAIPELGAVLFVSGWCQGDHESPPPRTLLPPHRSEFLAIALFAAIVLLMQSPRVNRVIFQYDELSAPMPLLRTDKSEADLESFARNQRHALVALDQLERSARVRAMSQMQRQEAARRIFIPGMAGNDAIFGTEMLLDIPEAATRPVESATPGKG